MMGQTRRNRPYKGDLREAAILEAAQRLFAEKPYDTVTIDDLAGVAGLSRTGFYFYFRSKDAVLTALLTRFWDQLGDSHVWFDSTGPSPELLREQLRVSSRLWREHAAVLACGTTSGRLREFTSQVKARYDERAVEKIRRDQEQGLATTTLPAHRLAEMISAIRDARYEQLAAATDAELDEAVADLAEAIQRLIYA
jgi:AcrR family transcriptional regulator